MSIETNGIPSVDYGSIKRGSIIQTYNKAIKKNFLLLVLATSDVYTCIKLTDNPLFKKVAGIRLDISDMGIEDEQYRDKVVLYANVFGGTSIIKPEYVTHVYGNIRVQDYYSIVSTMLSYYLGFYHNDVETGEYIIDTPYIRNPIYTMLFGMVPVDEVIKQEVTSKTRIEENIEKDHTKENDKKSDSVPKVKKTSDIQAVFDSINQYPDDLNLRVQSIFKAFANYLIDEKLPVKQISDAILGKGLKKARKNSMSFNMDEFAYMFTHSTSDIMEKLNCTSSYARTVSRCVDICYFGRNVSARTNSVPAEINEYLDALYASVPNVKKRYVIDKLIEKFKLSESEANQYQYRYIKRRGGYDTGNDKTPKNSDDTVLRIIDFKWIGRFDKYNEFSEKVLNYYENRTKVYSGALKVDTGDIVMDACILYSVCKVVSRNRWFDVIRLPIYKDFRKEFNKLTYADLRSRFNLSEHQDFHNFSKSALIIVAIVCFIEEMDEKVGYLHKSVALGNQNVNPKFLCYYIGIFFRSGYYQKILMAYIAEMVGITIDQTDTLIKACIHSAEDIDTGIRSYKRRSTK